MFRVMRDRVFLGLVGAGIAAGAAWWTLVDSTGSAQERAAGNRPACVEVGHQARFDGVGYQHWVAVHNTCARPVECAISTDVAPTPVTVRLSPRERREVSTFLSSPASVFRPRVDCTEVR